MEKMISYCGLACSECPAYIASQTDDDELRAKTAEQWSKEYSHEMKPGDINCDGCLKTGGRHINYCSVCEIRKCGSEKHVVNCAYCDGYGCEKLTRFFQMAPTAKANLEEIRKNL